MFYKEYVSRAELKCNKFSFFFFDCRWLAITVKSHVAVSIKCTDFAGFNAEWIPGV